MPVTVTERWNGDGRVDDPIVAPPPSENAFHPSEHRRAFEHWYFDARLDNGYVVVAFLNIGRPDTPKPGVELHVYRPDGTRIEIRKNYPRAAVKASTEKVDVRIGHNTAVVEVADDGLHSYGIHLDEDGVRFDLTFASLLPMWQPGQGRTEYGARDFFAWCVGAPRARVSGTVAIGEEESFDATGIGYHDHNWGVGDMKRIIDHWYWGRLYAEDFTLIYANVFTRKRYDDEGSTPLMLAHDDRIVLSTGEVRVEPGTGIFDPVAGSEYPKTLRLVSDDVDVLFEVEEVIHAHDILADIPVVRLPLLRPAVKRVVGHPSYFRFRSKYTLQASVEGSDYERTGETLHEMVRLS